MEKRTMIALLLTIVLLFFFQMYFAPRQPVQEAPQAKPEEKAQTKTDAPSQPKVTGSVPLTKTEAPKPEETKATQRFLVETPLFKVTFTDLGGGIESVKLNQYKEAVKGVGGKELVQDIKPYSYTPKVSKTTNGSTVNDRTIFKPDKNRMSIQDKPETIIFSGTLTDGKRIRKIYTFYPDKYTIDMKIEVEATDADKAMVDFTVISGTNPNSYVFKGPFIYNGKKFEQIDKIDKDIAVDKTYTYAGLDEGFFAFIWLPSEDSHFPLTIHKAENNVPVLRMSMDKGMATGRLFFGPKQTDVLKSLDVQAQKIIDFGWFDVIAKPLIWALNMMNRVTRNYGINIIILTIFIKIIFYPLTVKSSTSMKKMQKLQPMIVKLKEKYKDDKTKLNQEMMAIYKREGVNPMGGCLPMIIQIPVFFALYKALSGAIELRHAHFLWWMNDLSAPEDLFTLSVAGYALPIRILPLIMGITQVLQQKMTPTTADPMQEKIMLLMPIVFTFLFWGFPSGLVLYWLVNNVISIAQQYYINKKAT
ncbi:MAG TPA: membrane protein insertase YidC [Syntrophorhabdus sp.]|jgi:YidC/Oxa1 family membrane protein insertase|nr:membrane protein insertase YidC [Syntrophorhabdus sp.]OPX96401.1 MAG: Membrane protein insertase YidC [Syntrophorhabdus sp. PtaB.Bin027]OQB76516.1 MAG: Membrane protein insertase YidC [Deltaproteobacteria bacterium ADurb.Bin135]MBP8744143.1 membrane protein insertase YidC [Syntrophorhabdus sp.]NMC94303.1 membrane protein insertase YidC [Syntrophorhabdus sp.]